jgi:hypothetical protein
MAAEKLGKRNIKEILTAVEAKAGKLRRRRCRHPENQSP